jgi:hypothetical protein
MQPSTGVKLRPLHLAACTWEAPVVLSAWTKRTREMRVLIPNEPGRSECAYRTNPSDPSVCLPDAA